MSAELWELLKGTMLALVTMGTGYLIRTVRILEFEMQEVKHTLTGSSGADGLRGESRIHDHRLDELEIWRTKLDTATAIERELYEGEERRLTSRRLRDQLLDIRLKGEHE